MNLNTFLLIDGSVMLIGLPMLMIFKGIFWSKLMYLLSDKSVFDIFLHQFSMHWLRGHVKKRIKRMKISQNSCPNLTSKVVRSTLLCFLGLGDALRAFGALLTDLYL